MRKLTLTMLILTGVWFVCAGCEPSGVTQLTEPSEVPDPDPPDGSARVTVDALIFEDDVYPTSNFKNVTGNECDGNAHWHSDEPVPSIGELSRRPSGDVFLCHDPQACADCGFPTVFKTDPKPKGCGHGKVSEVKRQNVQLFQDCVNAYGK